MTELNHSKMAIQDQYVFMFLFLFVAAILVQSAEPLNYVNFFNVSDITTSSAELTWVTPDDVSDISHYLLLKNVNDENTRNDTIALGTTSFTLTGLRYHKIFTYELMTVANSGDSLGMASVTFLTLYDPFNKYAVAAIAIGVCIFLTWMSFFIIRKKCDPHQKASARLKKEILEMQQKEKEEKKKKISSQPLVKDMQF